MAKVGMLHPRYCLITPGEDDSGNETETYGEVKTFSKAIRANTSVNFTQVDLYADDGLAESASEFVNGSMTFEGDDIDDTVEAEVTGASVNTSGDIVNSESDMAPYLRFGFVVRRYKQNKSQYRGVIFSKLKFDPIADDYETKGETITFKTVSLTAKFIANISGHWRERSEWMDKAEDADAWVKTTLKTPAEPRTTA